MVDVFISIHIEIYFRNNVSKVGETLGVFKLNVGRPKKVSHYQEQSLNRI